jgi:serine/threonine protein kinase
MQRGGVQIKTQYTEEDALAYFMLNSTVEIFSTNSADGIILTLTLNNRKESSYSTIRQCVVEDVRRMILKLVIITPEDVTLWIGDKKKIYQELDVTEFEGEVAFQKRLFDSTHNLEIVEGQEMMDYSEAVCPCIIHSSVYGNNYDNGRDVEPENLSEHLTYLNTLKGLLRDNINYKDKNESRIHKITIERIFKTLNKETSFENDETGNFTKEKVNKLGFIFMEYAEGYQTLAELMKSPDPTTRRNCRLIAFLELSRVHDNDIIHNDFHDHNILINYDKKRGMIIDFGRSIYTEPENVVIRTEWKEKLHANRLLFLLYDAFFEIMHYEQRRTFDKICEKKIGNENKYFYLYQSYHWIIHILNMFDVLSFDNNCKISFRDEKNNNYTEYSTLLSNLIRDRNVINRLSECRPVLPTSSRRSISNLLTIREVPTEPLVDEPNKVVSDDAINGTRNDDESDNVPDESPPLNIMGVPIPDEKVIYPLPPLPPPPPPPKKRWYSFLTSFGRGSRFEKHKIQKKNKPTKHKKQKLHKTKKRNKTKRNKTRRKQYKPKI